MKYARWCLDSVWINISEFEEREGGEKEGGIKCIIYFL